MLMKKSTRTSIAKVAEEVEHRLTALCSAELTTELMRHAEKGGEALIQVVLKNPCLDGWIPLARVDDPKTSAARRQPQVSPEVVAEAQMLQPNFYDSCVRPTLELRTRTQLLNAQRLGERMDLAEVVIMCCAVLRCPAPNPTAALFDLIDKCFRRWDELDALDELAWRTRRVYCSLGGVMRHAKHAEIKEKAIPLLASAAPPEGWLSKAHAGDVVAELVVQIAIEAGYVGSVQEDQWSRTIQQLIRDDPRAKEAFESNRSARRCHRTTGTRAQDGRCARRADRKRGDKPKT